MQVCRQSVSARPQHPSQTIITSLIIQPHLIKRHEVVEVSGGSLSVVQKAQICAHHPQNLARTSALILHYGGYQGSRIVVCGIAGAPIGYGKNGVLDHSSRVGECLEMLKNDWRVNDYAPVSCPRRRRILLNSSRLSIATLNHAALLP